MRTIVVLALTVLMMSLAAAQQVTPKPLPAFDQELIAVQKQFLQALMDKNVSAVDRSVANDAKGIAENGDMYDREEIVSSAREGLPKTTRSYDFQVVKIDDDAAVVAFNLIVPGDSPRYRHMADTWTKMDGKWTLKFRQMTPNLWSAKDVD